MLGAGSGTDTLEYSTDVASKLTLPMCHLTSVSSPIYHLMVHAAAMTLAAMW